MKPKNVNFIEYSCGIDETIIYDPSMKIIKTKESFVWFNNKKEPYLDFIMGYSSTNFGHCNNELIKVMTKAIKKYDNLPAFHSIERNILDEKIIKNINIPNVNYKTYYTVGGAKAIDTAIKLVRANTNKNTIISFAGSFHGYSYGALMITDSKFVNKKKFGDMPGHTVAFPFPNKFDASSKERTDKILKSIERYIEENKDDIAGIIYEPVQGAAGFIIPPEGFLSSLEAIAKKNKIPTICDEIQTGLGRTGTFLNINQIKSISPDIILLGKSLACGYYPISAIIAEANFFKSVTSNKSGFDSTFSNNNLGIAIANSTIDLLTKKTLKSITKKGEILFDELCNLKELSIVMAINNIGFALSIKFICKKNPILSNKIAEMVKKKSFKQRLIIQTAGVNGDYIKISPSFYISEKNLRKGIKILRKVIISVDSNWDKLKKTKKSC